MSESQVWANPHSHFRSFARWVSQQCRWIRKSHYSQICSFPSHLLNKWTLGNILFFLKYFSHLPTLLPHCPQFSHLCPQQLGLGDEHQTDRVPALTRVRREEGRGLPATVTVTGKHAFQGGEHAGQSQQSGNKSVVPKHEGAHQRALLDEAGTGRHSWGQGQEPHPNQDPGLITCRLGEKVFHLEESDALTHTVEWLLLLLRRQGILVCIALMCVGVSVCVRREGTVRDNRLTASAWLF